eukprot:TRINITY_DN4661_c0_g1_i6.p1 TRINITY_DN4661_c0_g1~~TRINITY_DN4661_c0_g1_i6.p1  ORF type:complete len:536 (+),score=80.35 TRINITY_DN4661_c0_g1_i6:43-1650(+)
MTVHLGEIMESGEGGNDTLTESEVRYFFDSLADTQSAKFEFTIDYFDTSIGVLYNKETPTCIEFCAALLREILCTLKSSHVIWDKIKYAAFLASLAARNYEFGLLYDIYHQLEIEIQTNNLSWDDDRVKSTFDEKVRDKIVVKDESLENIIELDSVDHCEDRKITELSEDHEISEREISPDDPQEEKILDSFEKNQELKNHEERKYDKKQPQKRRKSNKKSSTKHSKSANETLCEESTNENTHREDYDIKSASDKVEKENASQKYRRRKNPTIHCLLCQFTAKTQKHMDKHAFEVHADNRLCAQCGHMSATYEDYARHNETHILTCEVCCKKILGVNGMEDHMKMHRKTGFVPRVSCHICGTIVRKTYIKSHIENVHGSGIHKCELCNFTANSKDKISWHRKRHFMKMAKCPVCGIMVKNLKYHYRSKCSGKIERMTCSLCEKSFCNKRSLDTHIKHIHEKVMEHQCNQCEHKTYSKYNLRLHISKVHTKEDLQKTCPYCSQKTTSLDYHIKIFHFDNQVKSQTITTNTDDTPQS